VARVVKTSKGKLVGTKSLPCANKAVALKQTTFSADVAFSLKITGTSWWKRDDGQHPQQQRC